MATKPQRQARIVPYKETHQHGMVSLENLAEITNSVDLHSCDFGIQIASDGRVWICINGMAYLRFKPVGK